MDLLTELSRNGLLGLLLAISLFGIVYLFKLLINEKDKRLTDSQQMTSTLIEPLKNLQTTANLILEKIDGRRQK